MSFRDALYLLETNGLKVLFKGNGKVRSQSINPGAQVKKGQIIELTLS